ncbi:MULTISPECIES: hypothetical protein [unclassified Mycobacterium]|uniref:hypothetical protein n=1 Tax=unclassified Mycobacterium TaxID=2642494 RepID=UPI000AA7FD53|nr:MULTISPECIES: hypothetical protein [unclassified Mycobacterium]
MLHLLPKFHSLRDQATPRAEPAQSAAAHHPWPGGSFMTAIAHIHFGPSEPPRLYPLHEAGYLEAELMSRLMERL